MVPPSITLARHDSPRLRHCHGQPSPAFDPAQRRGDDRAWYRHVGELEHVATYAAHDPGADLDQLPREVGSDDCAHWRGTARNSGTWPQGGVAPASSSPLRRNSRGTLAASSTGGPRAGSAGDRSAPAGHRWPPAGWHGPRAQPRPVRGHLGFGERRVAAEVEGDAAVDGLPQQPGRSVPDVHPALALREVDGPSQ
jgi:hypothetical protein